jgi:hypothetical protein
MYFGDIYIPQHESHLLQWMPMAQDQLSPTLKTSTLKIIVTVVLYNSPISVTSVWEPIIDFPITRKYSLEKVSRGDLRSNNLVKKHIFSLEK